MKTGLNHIVTSKKVTTRIFEMSLSFSRMVTSANNSCTAYHIAKAVHEARDITMYIYYNSTNNDCRQMIEKETLIGTIREMVDDACEELHLQIATNKLLLVEADLMAKDRPTGRLEKRVFDHSMKMIEFSESKYYKVLDGMKIEVIPRHIEAQQDRLYVSGPSGSGKSRFSSIYARNYLLQFPGNRVFIFSRKEFDPILDGVVPGLIRVALNRELVGTVTRPGTDVLNEYSNSLLLFDDFDGVEDVTIRTAVQHFKNSMLNLGRQYGISIISITHKLLSGVKSREEMIEATHFVVFPQSNIGEVKKLFKSYCGFEKEHIEKILDEEGKAQRWMCIVRPNIIITEGYIKVIKL